MVWVLAVWALVASAALLVASRASADAPEARALVTLDYRAPASCPDREAVEGDVEALLERSVFDAEGTHRLRVELTEGPARAVIELMRVEGEVILGTRTLEGEGDCRELAAPLALVLALLVDLSAEDIRLHLPAPMDAPAPTSTEVALVLGAGVELGLGPQPTALTSVGVTVAPLPFFVLGFELLAQPYAELGADRGVAMSALSLATDVCGRLVSAEGHALDLCGSAALGGVLGRGRGVDVAREALVGWVVLGAAIRARIALDATWFLGTTVRVGANAVGPAFAVQDGETTTLLSRAAPLEASAALVLGARWTP